LGIVIPRRRILIELKLERLIYRLASFESVDTHNCKCYFVIRQHLSTATPVSYLNRIIPMYSYLILNISLLEHLLILYVYSLRLN